MNNSSFGFNVKLIRWTVILFLDDNDGIGEKGETFLRVLRIFCKTG